MRSLFFAGVLISLIPLFIYAVFNGLSLLGLAIVAFAVYRIIKKEGLA
jgi:hypothetical protein